MAAVARLRDHVSLEKFDMTYYTYAPSPFGDLLLLSDGEALTGLFLPSHKHGPGGVSDDWERDDELPVLKATSAQLADYFAGTLADFDIPVRLDGTPFQRAVWNELTKIPNGTTISYGELARRVGNPKASRAVGLANGRNPVSIIVPCHRVVGSNGSLTGYGGGIDRKRALLQHETEHWPTAPLFTK